VPADGGKGRPPKPAACPAGAETGRVPRRRRGTGRVPAHRAAALTQAGTSA